MRMTAVTTPGMEGAATSNVTLPCLLLIFQPCTGLRVTKNRQQSECRVDGRAVGNLVVDALCRRYLSARPVKEEPQAFLIGRERSLRTDGDKRRGI